MKKLAWVLLAFAAIYADLALAKGDPCDARIRGNAEYAQWGLDLRKDMLEKCGATPSKSCYQKYENIISQQDKKNQEALDKAFAGYSGKNAAYSEGIFRNIDKKHAAAEGLKGSSVKSTTTLLYKVCTGDIFEEKRGSTRLRGMPPMPPPMMPMEPSISSRLSPMQPEMSGGSPFGSCNNYNYLGPNGQAVYCQQCCHGDGNCQTICN